MPEIIRALIVVLVLAGPAFYFSERLSSSAIAHREFAVWRNAWFAFTIAGFLSGSAFVFAAVAAMICLYVHSVRGATVTLFIILLFTVPLVDVTIGVFGVINNLIEFNNARLLVAALLLPILFTTVGFGHRNDGASAMPDRLIIAYVLLSVALAFRQSNFTSIMRGMTEITIDILIPYFAFSRTVTNVANFRKVLLAFVVAVLPLSLIAVLEMAKGWPLYNSIIENWAGAPPGASGREGMFRGSASAGPIVLGLIIMVAIGCMLAVRQTTILPRRFAGTVLGVFTVGLIATLSRGPWVGTGVLVFAYLATGPNPVAKLSRGAVIAVLALLPLLFTPVGRQLIDLLPFIGSSESGTVTYRQHLFENAILVVERNLWFGSVDYRLAPEMQEMMQGQGMIDIVNTYLAIALDSGLVGLGLFVGTFATILVGLWRVIRFGAVWNVDCSVYARASTAILIAILVTIGTVSPVGFIPYVYWSFAGLCVALIRIAYRERAAVARTAVANRIPG